MTSKSDATDYRKTQRLQRYGFESDPTSVRIDKGETPLHVASRQLCGLVLANAGHTFDLEVRINDVGDRVDVLDYGASADEHPLAIECESVPDRPTIETKLDKYVYNGPCRDVIILDLRDAPTEIHALYDWIESKLAV